MGVVVSLLVLLLTVVAIQVQFALRKRRLFTQSWDSILSRVEPMDFPRMREIADLFLQPGKDQLRIEPNDMWKTVGGLQGLGQMRQNAQAMLDLAIYAERWQDDNGRVVSEMMRRDAMRVKQAIRNVELSFFWQMGLVRAPFHLQEAISSYCLMRARLMALYQTAHVGLIPRIEAAL